MCRRKTRDPLLSYLSERGYTMLQNPRQGVEPADAWVELDKRFDPVGPSTGLIEGGFELPTPTEVRLGDLDRTRSDVIDANAALRVLGGALAAMGLPAVVAHLSAKFGMERSVQLRVTLSEVTARELSLTTIARALATSQVRADVGRMLTDGRRVAVATSVVRASGLLVEALEKSGGAFDLGVDATLLGSAKGGRRVQRMSASQLLFTGSDPIAIGVKLYEAVFDASRTGLRLKGMKRVQVLDRPTGATEVREPKPLLAGGAGELFCEL